LTINCAERTIFGLSVGDIFSAFLGEIGMTSLTTQNRISPREAIRRMIRRNQQQPFLELLNETYFSLPR
jgi:hypothetical protein